MILKVYKNTKFEDNLKILRKKTTYKFFKAVFWSSRHYQLMLKSNVFHLVHFGYFPGWVGGWGTVISGYETNSAQFKLSLATARLG